MTSLASQLFAVFSLPGEDASAQPIDGPARLIRGCTLRRQRPLMVKVHLVRLGAAGRRELDDSSEPARASPPLGCDDPRVYDRGDRVGALRAGMAAVVERGDCGCDGTRWRGEHSDIGRGL